MSIEERRSHPRLNVLVDSTYAKKLHLPKSEVSLARNISGGGVCLIAYQEISEGDTLDLNIYLNVDNLPIQATGKVVWVKVNNVGETTRKRYDVGVQFLNISSPDKGLIDKYILGNNVQ